MAYKREEQKYQPEMCLICKKIWKVDCDYYLKYEKLSEKGFECGKFEFMKKINGKKK